MTESIAPGIPSDGRSAGQVLRDARLAKGLTVAGLGAQLRVSVARLEALEADHTDELHGTAYTRSLAIAVCRALGIEPAPILQRLPAPDDSTLGEVGAGLNAPFRAGSTVGGSAQDWLARPLVWGPAVILVAAAVVWWWPQGGTIPGVTTVAVTPVPPSPAASPATSPPLTPPAAASATALPSTLPSVETVHSAPSDAAASSLDASRPLQIRTSGESWIEVLDARGAVLLSRTLQAGEQVGLAGAMPLQIKIGNATSTSVQWRGQSIELAAHTRDNVARLEVR